MSTTCASKISWISLADEVVHRLRVEPFGQALRTLVDDRAQLARCCLGRSLLEQPSVLQRDAQAASERGQQPHVRVAERVLAVEVLQRDHAGRSVADDQRNEDARLRRLTLNTTAGFPASTDLA